jgi:hypothetical protein
MQRTSGRCRASVLIDASQRFAYYHCFIESWVLEQQSSFPKTRALAEMNSVVKLRWISLSTHHRTAAVLSCRSQHERLLL